jgi:hypothetical protein
LNQSTFDRMQDWQLELADKPRARFWERSWRSGYTEASIGARSCSIARGPIEGAAGPLGLLVPDSWDMLLGLRLSLNVTCSRS